MMRSFRRDQWRTLIAMAMVFIVLNLDYFGLSIALPTIGHNLNSNTAALGWILNANLVAFAVSIVTFGRLADMFGRRRLAIFGIVLFVLSSTLSGLSTELVTLIAARGVLGFSVAMISATMLPLVSKAFEAPQRAAAIGLWMSIGYVGAAAGPFLCGLLIEALSWRWFFFVNAGIAVTTLLLVLIFVKESPRERTTGGIDIPGFLTLTVGLILLVFGLEIIESLGWTSPWVIATLAGAAAMLILFYFVEKAVAAPLVDFSLFAERDFLAVCVISFVASVPYGALFLFLTLYLQHLVSFSPTVTGIIFLAMIGPFMLATFFTDRLTEYIGARALLTVALILVALAFASFGFARADEGIAVVLLGLALFGLGQGLVYSLCSVIAMAAIPEEKAGVGSGVVLSIRGIATPIGIAIMGVVFRATENDRLLDMFGLAGNRLGADAQDQVRGLLSGSESALAKLSDLAPAIGDRVQLVASEAFTHAFRDVMFLAIFVVVAGIAMTFMIRARPDGSRPTRIPFGEPGAGDGVAKEVAVAKN